MEINRFNIRVYGLLFQEEKILVTDEFRLNTYMTKFPGGALEFGEGTIECLKREFREELKMEIDVISHVYTTDFFQPTMLIPSSMQLISIYYKVSALEPMKVPVVSQPFDFGEAVEGAQCFRWVDMNILTRDMMTFPIDRKVVDLIRQSRDKHYEVV